MTYAMAKVERGGPFLRTKSTNFLHASWAPSSMSSLENPRMRRDRRTQMSARRATQSMGGGSTMSAAHLLTQPRGSKSGTAATLAASARHWWGEAELFEWRVRVQGHSWRAPTRESAAAKRCE